jgi:beta-phosphoglucomutase-like phosphatase (HAD superfamily)
MDVGLIFDLDGTLLDSTFIIGQVMNETRLSLGYPHLEFDVYNQLIGLPPIELVSDLSVNSQEKESIIKIFRRNLPNVFNEGVQTFVYTVYTLKL